MASLASLKRLVVGSLGVLAVTTNRKSSKRFRDVERRSNWLEERSRQVIGSASIAYAAFDADGSVIDWNGEARRRFGWTRADLLGRNVFDVFIVRPFEESNITDIEPTSDPDAPLLGRQMLASVRHKDGTEMPADLHAWATRHGDSRTFNLFIYDPPPPDVPPGKSSCEMGAIIESSGEAIIGTDLETNVKTWNRAAEEMFGYVSSEAVGRPLVTIVPPEGQPALARAFEALGHSDTVEHEEAVWSRRDGSQVSVAVTLSTVRDVTGGATGFTVIARDVTEERRMTAELDETLAALDAAVREAREAEARGRDFLADAAHQLRTPTAGIRACAEALLRYPSFPPDAERLVADMMSETSRAARLIGALLQMARLDQGGFIETAPCDLVALCHDEVERARSLAPGLDVAVRVAKRFEEKPELDSGAVREILANLLDNARRYAVSSVQVVVSVTDDLVEVRVVDDGPGVGPEVVDRIFHRFVTLDGKGGSGLGLPIARGLARAQGGDLAYDEGFVLRLPAHAEIDADMEPVDR